MTRLVLLFALGGLAACTTAKEVRSGAAWRKARPSDYEASAEDVLREVEVFLAERNFLIEYGEDKSYVKAYRPGDDPIEQNVEMHVRIEPGPGAGLTRVTAVSGRSLGIEWAGRRMHERLHNHLRAAFGANE